MLVLLIVFCSIIECYCKSIHAGLPSGGAHKRTLARNSSYEIVSPTNSNFNDIDTRKQSLNSTGYIDDDNTYEQSGITKASIDEDNSKPQHEYVNANIDNVNNVQLPVSENAKFDSLNSIKALFAANPEFQPAITNTNANVNARFQHETNNGYIEDTGGKMTAAVENPAENALRAQLRPASSISLGNVNYRLQPGTSNVYIPDDKSAPENTNTNIENSNAGLQHVSTNVDSNGVNSNLQPVITKSQLSNNTITYSGIHDIKPKLRPLVGNTHTNRPLHHMNANATTYFDSNIPAVVDNSNVNRVESDLHIPSVGGTVINAPIGDQRVEVCTINPHACGYSYAKKVCDDCYQQSISGNTPLIDDRCAKNACYCCQMSHGNNCNDVCAAHAPAHRPVTVPDTRPVAPPDPQPVHFYIGKCQDDPCQCCLNARKVSCEHVCAGHDHNGLINGPLAKCENPCQCCQLTGQNNCAQLCFPNNNVLQQTHHFHQYPVTVVHHNVLNHHSECDPSDNFCDSKHTIPNELDDSPSDHDDHHGTVGYMNTDHDGSDYARGDDDGYSHDHDGSTQMDVSNKAYSHGDSSNSAYPNWGYSSDINVKTPLYTDSSHMDFGGSPHPHSSSPHMEYPSPHSAIASTHHDYNPAFHHGNSSEQADSMPGEDEEDLCDCSCGCDCGLGFTNEGMPKIPGIAKIQFIDHSRKGCRCTNKDCTCDNTCKDTCIDKCRTKCKCNKRHSVRSHFNETRSSF